MIYSESLAEMDRVFKFKLTLKVWILSKSNISVLVGRLGKGDVEAFREVYLIYYSKLLRYGNIILPDPVVVEDEIQDLFVWIFQNPEKIRHINNFEVYLFQSLKKNIVCRIKQNRRSQEILDQFLAENSIERYYYTVEDRLIQEESKVLNKKLLKRHFDSLPACQKEVIYLRYYEGLCYDEIAAVISKSNQVARNYAARALRHLRKIDWRLPIATFLLSNLNSFNWSLTEKVEAFMLEVNLGIVLSEKLKNEIIRELDRGTI